MAKMNQGLAIVICDGVEINEVRQMKERFEGEGMAVFLVSGQSDIEINSVDMGRTGPILTADMNLDIARSSRFSGVILADGIHCVDMMRDNKRLLAWLSQMHAEGYPVMASGYASRVLYHAGILSRFVVTRENMNYNQFVKQACELISEAPALAKERRIVYYLPAYRPVM